MEDFNLIHYPFDVEDSEELNLESIPGGYKMKFDNTVFSKYVKSTLNCGIKNYIEIDIDSSGEECRIISETNEIFEFITPADFHVPGTEESKKFYSEFLENLTTADLNLLEKYSLKFADYCRKYTLPEYPVPITTTAIHLDNTILNKSKINESSSYYSLQIKIKDKVPDSIPQDIVENIKNDISGYKFTLQDTILSRFFLEKKMVKIKEIEEFYSKDVDEKYKSILNYTLFKKAISLHAYFYIDGPWRHCWVHIGYDPTLHRENYKHQTLYYKDTHVPFQLKQYPEIIEEVEKRPDWFLLPEFDINNGFISEALYNLISYIIYN